MPQTSRHSTTRGIVGRLIMLPIKLVLLGVLSFFVVYIITGIQILYFGYNACVVKLAWLLQQQQILLHNHPTQLHIIEQVQRNTDSSIVSALLAKYSLSFSNSLLAHNAFLTTVVTHSYPSLLNVLQALLITTQLVIARYCCLFVYAPVFLVLGLVALIDGLVQRDLRRLSGGRESALLYHRARNSILPALLWGGFLYVTLPFHIMPDMLLTPFVLLFAFTLFLTAKTFKKYL